MRSASRQLRVTMLRKTVSHRAASLKNDAKTVALWHFDEPEGTRKFSDASGNAHHLVGKNGAKTGVALAVEAQGKLTTTSGQLKR